MSSIVVISEKQSRKLVLQSQKLLNIAKTKNPLQALEAVIQHLGYIQIDTIAVVARAHHHVLWTRLKEYQPALLEHLVAEKKVFEYWYHAASYLPMKDFRFCLPRMVSIQKKKPYRIERTHPLYQNVLKRIKAEGPLQAKDFQSKTTPSNGGGWWDWKPAKCALEQLFMEGKLLVVGRNGFQKIYDVPERALPSDLDQTPPTPEEYAGFLIRRGIQAQGIITAPQTRYLREGVQKTIQLVLHQMLEAGEVVQVRVAKAEENYWTFPQHLEQTLKLPPKNQFFFLSPFDNLVIQRARLQALFGFNYQLECYVPAPKRQYGYFSLPMLWRDNFVGRADMKADRQSKTLLIKNLVLEQPPPYWQEFVPFLKDSLLQFMVFNGCEQIKVLQTQPSSLKSQIAFF